MKFAPIVIMTIDNGRDTFSPEVPAYVAPIIMDIWEGAPGGVTVNPTNRYHEVSGMQEESNRLRDQYGARFKTTFPGGAFAKAYGDCVVNESDVPQSVMVAGREEAVAISRVPVIGGGNVYLVPVETAAAAEIRVLREGLGRAPSGELGASLIGEPDSVAAELIAVRNALAEMRSEMAKVIDERDTAVAEAERAIELATAPATKAKHNKP